MAAWKLNYGTEAPGQVGLSNAGGEALESVVVQVLRLKVAIRMLARAVSQLPDVT